MAFIHKENRTPPPPQAPAARAEVKRKITPAFFKSEGDLCELFIREFNALEGWTCYPEAGGFDVLVVHDDGRQIGVEAKLVLNAKVADQILPEHNDDYHGTPGPDHRMVIVSKITEANAGIAKMLERHGVRVLRPTSTNNKEFSFWLKHEIFETTRVPLFSQQHLFDWNPSERCQVPMVVSDLPAGVPAPVRLTPWKESALKIIALMRKQGFITNKQIAEHGIGVGRWTQPRLGKPAWLAKGAVQGLWVETEHLPPFDKQHPDAYLLAVQGVIASPQKEFALS